MGEPVDHSAAQQREDGLYQDLRFPQGAAKSRSQQGQMPFYSQFDCLQQRPDTYGGGHYASPVFDMSVMSAALPQRGQDGPNVLPPASVYHRQQASQFPGCRGPPFDSGSQPQQLMQQQYPGARMNTEQRPTNVATQFQGQVPGADMYRYAMGGSQFSPIDPRFAGSAFAMGAPMGGDYPPYARQPSEPAPVPAFPRGPPRKPKQSGHALWVGNLPPAATVTDLKDHFSRDATKDIESLFLIAKSNCAFVNYRTEAACVAAMNRFHDSRFNGVRLVCRLRRGSTSCLASPIALEAPSPTTSALSGKLSDGVPPESTEGPTIVGQVSNEQPVGTTPGEITAPASITAQKVSEKFFIVKSLTVQDLEASVHNGTWATQSHNERVLNEAYDGAENVYLIFSANKSGEYFGYARMVSQISGEPIKIASVGEREDAGRAGNPQSIPTQATETAPGGHIIDDSARGTIFWEADLSGREGSDSPTKEIVDHGDGQHWGRQFQIEWISTSRLPFFRTRGLRNPWNANREVKIARDGTEMEPSVGRRLVAMFHRSPSPPGGIGTAMGPPAGMPYPKFFLQGLEPVVRFTRSLSHAGPFVGMSLPWAASPWTRQGGIAGRWQQASA